MTKGHRLGAMMLKAYVLYVHRKKTIRLVAQELRIGDKTVIHLLKLARQTSYVIRRRIDYRKDKNKIEAGYNSYWSKGE